MDYTNNMDLSCGRGQIDVLLGGKDYRPLYLIPYDINVAQPDNYTQSVVKEKIRSSFVALTVPQLGPETFEINLDNLLKRVIILWDTWEDNDSKRNLRKRTKYYLIQIAKYLNEKYRLGMIQVKNGFKIGPVSNETKNQVINYFKSKEYRKGEFSITSEKVEQIEFNI